MSQEDLIPINTRSKEEAQEISRRGGIASGEARREKSKLQRIIRAYLDTTDETGLDNETKIITALGTKANKADVLAVKELFDRIYDKPKQSQDITQTIVDPNKVIADLNAQ